MDDWDLLRDYVTTQSQEAFKILVVRHVDFVYSAALRQVRDRHLAEDVTQSVFIVLSQKAAELARQRPGALEGWLFKVARFTSANAMKAQKRRRRHEASGSLMTQRTSDPAAADWQALCPHLDQAIAALARGDRDAVLLRFFSDKSHRDIAQTLGISEEAARKRVARAIEKLRQLLARQGVTVASAALGSLLATHAVQAAPSGLAAVCAQLSGAAATAAPGFATGTSLLAAAKANLLAALSVLIILAGTAGLMLPSLVQPSPPPAAHQKQAAPIMLTLLDQPHPAQSMVGGVVRSSTGEPVSGADVSLATKDHRVDIYDKNPSGAAQTRTADDGAFAFDAPDGPCQVVVRHSLGYAQATREQLIASNGNLTLLPWGRVEGALRIGPRLAPDNVISLSRRIDPEDPYSSLIRHVRETKTDQRGRFVFDQLAPGDAWIYRHQLAREPQAVEHLPIGQYVRVQSAATVSLNIGGTGRPVIGRMVPPPDAATWATVQSHGYRAALHTPQPIFASLGRPTFTPQTSYEEQRSRFEQWSRLPAALQYKRNQHPWTIVMRPDGSFRIEDVPGGLHTIQVDYWELQPGAPFADVPGVGSFSFVVPEMPNGRSDQPLDLGALQLESQERLIVGQEAPDFQVQGVDAKRVRSSDFRGNFILLCLWTTERPLSRADIAHLKHVYQTHVGDGKLTILTAQIGGDPGTAQKFAAENDLPWPQFTAQPPGNWLGRLLSPTDIPEQYQRLAFPITLIDPQGRVAARNLSGTAIEEEVYRAVFAE